MKKLDAVNLYNAIINLPKGKNTKLNYACLKNLKRLQPIIEGLKEKDIPVKGKSEYEAARLEICEQHADKDEEGKPIIENNTFKISDQDTFKEVMDQLREQHIDVFKAEEELKKEISQILEEEIELNIHKVDVEELPKDLETDFVSALIPMIK